MGPKVTVCQQHGAAGLASQEVVWVGQCRTIALCTATARRQLGSEFSPLRGSKAGFRRKSPIKGLDFGLE